MIDKNTIRIYGCGGCGSNIVRLLENLHQIEGFAKSEICYIDTSRSNMRDNSIDASKVYIFEGVDGSGKVRAENHEVISKNIPKIMDKFKPSTFNILVTSASGGSGSVIAHNLLTEIIKRGEYAIVIAVGTTDSMEEISNTIKTLKSFDAINQSLHTNRPIVMHYLENSANVGRDVINNAARQSIVMLSALMSGQNQELDTADVKGWMTHRNIHPELVALQFANSAEEYAQAGDVVSVATLAKRGTNTSLSPVPAYQAVGFVPDSWSKGDSPLIDDRPAHFTISSDMVTTIGQALDKKLADINSRLKSFVRRDSLANSSDPTTGNGMFL